MDRLRSLRNADKSTTNTPVLRGPTNEGDRPLRESANTPGPSGNEETETKSTKVPETKKINSDTQVYQNPSLAEKFAKLSKTQQESILRLFPDLLEISRQNTPQKVEICEEDDEVLEEGDELSDEDWSEEDVDLPE